MTINLYLSGTFDTLITRKSYRWYFKTKNGAGPCALEPAWSFEVCTLWWNQKILNQKIAMVWGPLLKFFSKGDPNKLYHHNDQTLQDVLSGKKTLRFWIMHPCVCNILIAHYTIVVSCNLRPKGTRTKEIHSDTSWQNIWLWSMCVWAWGFPMQLAGFYVYMNIYIYTYMYTYYV